MVSIVIAHSKLRLQHHLLRTKKANPTKGYYLILCDSFQRMDDLLKEHGLQSFQFSPLTGEQQDAILRDYVEALGRMGELNGQDMRWWATDIASKNRVTSPMPELLNPLVRCLDAIGGMTDGKWLLVLVGPPWPVVKALEESAQRLDWDLRVISWPWSRFVARLRGQIKTWIRLVRELAVSIFRILEAKHYFGRISAKTKEKRPVYLIKSFVYPSAFLGKGLYKDPFFGELPQFLSRRLGDTANILTVVIGSEKRTECYRKMGDVRDGQVVPLEVYLHLRDAVKGFTEVTWSGITKTFRVPEEVPFLGYDISGLFREIIASGGWKIPLGQYLHFAAAVRISKTHNISACTLTYEGNPWERMFIKGLQYGCPHLFIVGYQHAVIPQSAVGMFLSQREMSSVPLPSFVFTTGRVPATIMERYGALPKERLREACALRFGYLYNFRPMPRRSLQGTFLVLVVLEGLKAVLPLVEYVLDHAPKCGNVKFRIRAHPVLPFERLLSFLGRDVEIHENVEVSHGRSVLEDLEDCDAVLYWGTTVALEALMLGRPVIHFDRGDLLSYDPLFELDAFKWRVSDVTDLTSIVGVIRDLPDEEYCTLQGRARRYAMNYFWPADDHAMSQFLPPEVLRCVTRE
jgi:hypothetical protein